MTVSEAVHLFLRWAHLIAGIMWIGSSIFFHWLDSHIEPVAPEEKAKRPGLEGVLWMVHSGGFYEVEKKLVAPGEMPKVLHWFKWEAGFTLLTGWMLLVLLYHAGGGVMLVDAGSTLAPWQASLLCLFVIVVSWFVYDFVWSSKLAGAAHENPLVTVLASLLALGGIALLFTHFLSGRAAYIHTASVMGTCMVLNVWVRIIPFQKHLVDAVRAGQTPDASRAYGAKRRSKHNHYLTYPILFIMISNHFPSTYGDTHAVAGVIGWNWIILVALMLVSGVVKLWMNKRDPSASVMLAVLGVCVALVVAASIVPTAATTTTAAAHDAGTSAAGKPIGSTGRVRGVVTWKGDVPAPRDVQLMAGCEKGHPGGVVKMPAAIVGTGGALAEAFVHVAAGVEGYAAPAAPTAAVVVEQKACLYEPRVVGARVGQSVAFVNGDALFHNVRSVSTTNPTWAINQPAQGQRDEQVFRMPEVMVQTRCDVHPWMIAHVGVKEHPWFAVTASDGAFVLDGVPAGDVVVEVWHAAAKQRARANVTVPAGGDVTLALEMAADIAPTPTVTP